MVPSVFTVSPQMAVALYNALFTRRRTAVSKGSTTFEHCPTAAPAADLPSDSRSQCHTVPDYTPAGSSGSIKPLKGLAIGYG
jgi:hypothetical protein